MNDKTELQRHDAAESGRKRVRAERPKGKGPKKEHSRRWLFLVVDLLLLAAIIGAVVFIINVLGSSDNGGSETEGRRITYQLEIAGIESDLFSATGGDSVFLSNGLQLGVVEYHDGGQPYTQYIDGVVEEGGKYFVTEVEYPEDIKTYLVTISVYAEFEAGIGYSVNDCRIAVGRSYRVRIADGLYDAVCVSLQQNAAD